MALVSVSPLGSKSCLHKSLMSSTPELKPLCRTIPAAGMSWRGKSVMHSVSMSLTTNISGDGVQRRIGDYHSNLWNDDILQSLSTCYGEPSYRERAERLISEVKKMFDSMLLEDGEFSPLNDLIQRLWMVDSVERLGIDRHFRNEIKSALDYVYSFWKEKGIGCGRDSVVTDLNSTALGLRTLRLHGYAVSAEVLKLFKGQNGQFACSAVQREGEIEIRSVVNLYRASLIAFPGEKVMEEAQIFSARYLKETLQKIPVSSLSREIGDILDNGWDTNLPRLEARNYIDVFIQDTKNTKTEKLLELAKLEFNMFHSLQKKELECLLRWWKDSGVPQMTFCRHRHVEYYALASCIAFEPQHSGFRLGFAKASHIITVLDDMYDIFGTVDELELFTAAIKRWDPSATEWLPEYMKPVYMMVYDTVNEMAREAEKAQGRDTLDYARKAWEVCLDSWMQEAKWIASGYLPSFEEYYENGKVSSAHRVCALQPILTLPDIPFPDHIFKRVDFPSKLNDLACAVLRLRGDTRCYKADRARGEEASSISCYMKENPGSTEEDALNHINGMISDVIRKLNWELLKPDSVPICAKKHAYDISRAFHYGYKYRDGYSVADIEMKNFVAISVLEPVPL